MKEALAVLEGRGYVPTKPTIWQRLDDLEAMTRSPNSICYESCWCLARVRILNMD